MMKKEFIQKYINDKIKYEEIIISSERRIRKLLYQTERITFLHNKKYYYRKGRNGINRLRPYKSHKQDVSYYIENNNIIIVADDEIKDCKKEIQSDKFLNVINYIIEELDNECFKMSIHYLKKKLPSELIFEINRYI